MIVAEDTLAIRGEVRFHLWSDDLPFGDDPELIAAFLDGRVFSGMRAELHLATTIVRNLVTNLGAQQWTSRIINGNTTIEPGWIALGNAVYTPAKPDTIASFPGEFFRKAISIHQVYQTYYLRYVMNSATTDWNGTALGACLTDSATAGAGNMFAAVSANQPKTSAQSLTTEWRVNVVNP